MPVTFDENGEVVLTPYDSPEAQQASGYADQLFQDSPEIQMEGDTFGAAPEIQMPNEDIYSPGFGPDGQPAFTGRQSVGGGYSVSGFNQPTFNYLQTKGSTGYEAERRNAANEATANVENYYKQYAPIAEAQKTATADIAEIEGKKARINSDAAAEQAKLSKEYHDDVEAAVTKGQLESKAAFDNYANIMQEIRSTQINPSQMWDNMSGGQRFGTLASVFIHDFLGAKGIHTSTMDTLNRAIDRNIEAQITNLNTKKSVADGFRNMYTMVREMSESDIEAKTKLHGIMLQSFKDDVASKLFGMDSELARSKGVLAMSELDKELLNKMQEVRKIEDTKAQVRVNQYLEKRGQDVSASNARLAANVQMAQIEAAKKPKPIDADKINAKVIVDPSPGATAGPRIFRGEDDKERIKLQNSLNFRSSALSLADEYVKLAREVGKVYDGPLAGMVNRDPKVARMVAIQEKMVTDMVTAAAATTFTDKFIDRMTNQLPKDTYLTPQRAEQVVGQWAQMVGQQVDTDLQGLTYAPNAEELAVIRVDPARPYVPNPLGADAPPAEGNQFFQAGRNIGTNMLGRPEPLDPVDRIFAESEHDVNLNDVVVDQSPELKDSWKTLTGELKPTKGITSVGLDQIPQWFGQLHRLREFAVDPNQNIALRQKAIGKLFEVSQSGDNVWSDNQAQAAAHLLYEINDDLFRPENAQEKRAADLLKSKTVEGSDYYSDYINMINSTHGVDEPESK